MGNVRGYGGPLPQSYIDDQAGEPPSASFTSVFLKYVCTLKSPVALPLLQCWAHSLAPSERPSFHNVRSFAPVCPAIADSSVEAREHFGFLSEHS